MSPSSFIGRKSAIFRGDSIVVSPELVLQKKKKVCQIALTGVSYYYYFFFYKGNRPTVWDQNI